MSSDGEVIAKESDYQNILMPKVSESRRLYIRNESSLLSASEFVCC
jgi:predicted membrane-bound spermidine synthase